MVEEWKAKGELLQELDSLRSRISQFEKIEHKGINGGLEELGLRFRRIFDNFAEGILFIDLEKKRLLTGNKAVCQILGYDVEEIVNLEFKSICPPEDSSHLIEQFERQADGELVLRNNIPVRRKDGNLVYVDFISVPLTFSGKIFFISFLRKTSIPRSKSTLASRVSQPLTETEIKVLQSIVKGMSNKEIAKLFRRSIRTVENHRAHIMKKLEVDNSIELVKRAVELGLIHLPEE